MTAPSAKGSRGGGTRAGIQSVEVARPLLASLAEAAGPVALTTLAKAAGMTPSKAHKYLTSLGRTGLVTQMRASGRYGLGPFALELGLAALRQLKVVDLAQEVLDDIRDRLELTASLSVWGNRGPTLVRQTEARTPELVGVRLGTVFRLLTSSSGRVFAAYLDRSLTQHLIDAELAVAGGPAELSGLRRAADVERLLANVRAHRIAVVTGRYTLTRITGISAPVRDHSGQVVAAVTVVAPDGTIATSRDSASVRVLREAADRLSQQLGAKPDGDGIGTDAEPPRAAAAPARRAPARQGLARRIIRRG